MACRQTVKIPNVSLLQLWPQAVAWRGRCWRPGGGGAGGGKKAQSFEVRRNWTHEPVCDASDGTALSGKEAKGGLPWGPPAGAGWKAAVGSESAVAWKAAMGGAKVGRWLASIPHPAPPRSAYVSLVPPVTLLEKLLLLLRSVPASAADAPLAHHCRNSACALSTKG